MAVDKDGQKLPDGQYGYELRLTPEISAADRASMQEARGKDDEPEAIRAARKPVVSSGLVQSGTFSILNGAVIVAGARQEAGSPVSKVAAPIQLQARESVAAVKAHLNHAPMAPDQVIADDLIVQGSACIGLDCVNGESFGFDTVRLKENNTRIKFEDTSNTAGFPTVDWQLTANDSASGGASKFSIDNIDASTTPFTIRSGAATNSLFVDSSSRVGLRTGTPVLDLHIATGNTPGIRLEQNTSSGFSAQTWDIAGNEANFFIRDVTGGSRLPFRIRPGAPTSSIDIASSGNVGIGTQSPGFPLDVSTTNQSVARFKSSANVNAINIVLDSVATFNSNIEFQQAGVNKWFVGNHAANDRYRITNGAAAGNAEVFSILQNGSVGIGTSAPSDLLSVNGNASKPGGGSWAVFSDERLKLIKGSFNTGIKAVMQLQPIRYQYKPGNSLGLSAAKENIGFGAQSLQKIIPEAVTQNSDGYLMVNNDPILWTMLNAIKEQQKEIETLKGEIRQLKATSRRRH